MTPHYNAKTSLIGAWLYDLVLPEDHFLRLVLLTVDWSAIRKVLTTDLNGQPEETATTGRPSYDPIVPFKMLFLQRLHPASDAKIEERARTDLAYRFFLQIPIPNPVPDATTLSRYRTAWGEGKVRELFTQIFAQIQAFGYADVKDGIVGDTTHQYAAIQKPSARELIIYCTTKWLAMFTQLGKEFPQFLPSQAISTFETQWTQWLTEYHATLQSHPVTKVERFAQVVTKVRELIAQGKTFLPSNYLSEMVTSPKYLAYLQASTLLERVLAENVAVDDDEITQKKGERKIISAVDPDARSGQKSKTNRFTGYKVSTAMTLDRFLAQGETLPGNAADVTQAVPLVKGVIENTGQTPSVAGFDLGYNSVANRGALHDLGVQPGIEFEHRTNPRYEGLYTADKFSLDFTHLQVTCPNKQTSTKYTTNTQNETYIFRFPATCCETCPVRYQCTTSHTGRTVSYSQHQPLLEEDRVFLATDIYNTVRKTRWGLESIFGTGKRSHNLTKSPYHGLAKTSVHNTLIYIVLNVKRLITQLYFSPAPPVGAP